MAKAANLIGQKFGMLTVIERGENGSGGQAMWVCICDCGNHKDKTVSSYDLKAGKVRSCGCLYKSSNHERNKKHGGTKTRLYSIWLGVRARCKNHPRYIENNIQVCAEWQNNYEAFRDWALANGYTDELTIDRIENSKGYSPQNCRWATMIEQQNNRTDNVRVSFNGEMVTYAELSRITGISQATLRNRHINGWTDEELLIKPSMSNRIKRRK